MTRDEALTWALSQRPESNGVARLCQELLSSYLEEPATWVTPEVPQVCARPVWAAHMIGNTYGKGRRRRVDASDQAV